MRCLPLFQNLYCIQLAVRGQWWAKLFFLYLVFCCQPAFFFLSTSRCESCFSLSFLADSFHDNPMTGYASVCLVRREGAGLGLL